MSFFKTLLWTTVGFLGTVIVIVGIDWLYERLPRWMKTAIIFLILDVFIAALAFYVFGGRV